MRSIEKKRVDIVVAEEGESAPIASADGFGGASRARMSRKALRQRKSTALAVHFGAPSGIRTRDPLIKSQLLYQLS